MIKDAAFIDLEESFTALIIPQWVRVQNRIAGQITKAIKEHDLAKVESILNTINPERLYKGKIKKINLLLKTGMFFGASRITGDTEGLLLPKNKEAIKLVGVATNQFKLQIHGIVDTMKKRYLRIAIALDAELTKEEQAKESFTKSDVKVQKVNPINIGNVIKIKGAAAGKGMVRVATSLQMSRMAGYGFAAEATSRGVNVYKINERLDSRICPVCREMHGKTFHVKDALRKLDTLIRITDPNDLKLLAPFPKQDKKSIAELKTLTREQLQARGYDTPPYHPLCRGLLSVSKEIIAGLDSGLGGRQIIADSPLLPNVSGATEAMVSGSDVAALSRADYSDMDDFFTSLFGGRGTAKAKLQKAVDDSDIYMSIKSTTLRNQIIKGDGLFKNSLETGKGTFKTIGETRAVTEKQMFGIVDDVVEAQSFPKYGFLSSSEAMSNEKIVGFGYGDVFVKFDTAALKNRSTFTMGDSFNNNRFDGKTYRSIAPPSRLADVDEQSLLSYAGKFSKDSPAATRLRGASTIDELAGVMEYPEVQMYGEVSITNVVEISTGSRKQADLIRKALKAKKLDIDVVPLKFDERIDYFIDWGDTALRHKASLSVEDIDRLGFTLLKKLGWHQRLTGVAKNSGAGFKYPEPLQSMVDDIAKYGKDVPELELREVSKEVARLIPLGKESGLPKHMWEDYRKTLSGWTDDIYNTELLKG